MRASVSAALPDIFEAHAENADMLHIRHKSRRNKTDWPGRCAWYELKMRRSSVDPLSSRRTRHLLTAKGLSPPNSYLGKATISIPILSNAPAVACPSPFNYYLSSVPPSSSSSRRLEPGCCAEQPYFSMRSAPKTIACQIAGWAAC